ncbi:hypothetical protein CYMTET_18776, partial [Cymbomonas tetramitiformis]
MTNTKLRKDSVSTVQRAASILKFGGFSDKVFNAWRHYVVPKRRLGLLPQACQKAPWARTQADLETIFEYIQKMPYFQKLSEEVCVALSRILRLVFFEERQEIITEGDPLADADYAFYVIVYGAVQIYKNEKDADASHIASIQTGGSFGDPGGPFLENYTRQATVISGDPKGPVWLLTCLRADHRNALQDLHSRDSKTKVDFCCRLPVFRKVPLSIVGEMSNHMVSTNFAANHTIFKQGTEGPTHIYLVISGKVDLMRKVTMDMQHIKGMFMSPTCDILVKKGNEELKPELAEEMVSLVSQRQATMNGVGAENAFVARVGACHHGSMFGDEGLTEKTCPYTATTVESVSCFSISIHHFNLKADQSILSNFRLFQRKYPTDETLKELYIKAVWSGTNKEDASDAPDLRVENVQSLTRFQVLAEFMPARFGSNEVPLKAPVFVPSGAPQAPPRKKLAERRNQLLGPTRRKVESMLAADLAAEVPNDELPTRYGLLAASKASGMDKEGRSNSSMARFLRNIPMKRVLEKNPGEASWARQRQWSMDLLDIVVASDAALSGSKNSDVYVDLLENSVLLLAQVVAPDLPVGCLVEPRVVDTIFASWAEMTEEKEDITAFRWSSDVYIVVQTMKRPELVKAKGSGIRPLASSMIDLAMRMKESMSSILEITQLTASEEKSLPQGHAPTEPVPDIILCAGLATGSVFVTHSRAGRFPTDVSGMAFDAALHMVTHSRDKGGIRCTDGVVELNGYSHTYQLMGASYVVTSGLSYPFEQTYEKLFHLTPGLEMAEAIQDRPCCNSILDHQSPPPRAASVPPPMMPSWQDDAPGIDSDIHGADAMPPTWGGEIEPAHSSSTSRAFELTREQVRTPVRDQRRSSTPLSTLSAPLSALSVQSAPHIQRSPTPDLRNLPVNQKAGWRYQRMMALMAGGSPNASRPSSRQSAPSPLTSLGSPPLTAEESTSGVGSLQGGRGRGAQGVAGSDPLPAAGSPIRAWRGPPGTRPQPSLLPARLVHSPAGARSATFLQSGARAKMPPRGVPGVAGSVAPPPQSLVQWHTPPSVRAVLAKQTIKSHEEDKGALMGVISQRMMRAKFKSRAVSIFLNSDGHNPAAIPSDPAAFEEVEDDGFDKLVSLERDVKEHPQRPVPVVRDWTARRLHATRQMNKKLTNKNPKAKGSQAHAAQQDDDDRPANHRQPNLSGPSPDDTQKQTPGSIIILREGPSRASSAPALPDATVGDHINPGASPTTPASRRARRSRQSVGVSFADGPPSGLSAEASSSSVGQGGSDKAAGETASPWCSVSSGRTVWEVSMSNGNIKAAVEHVNTLSDTTTLLALSTSNLSELPNISHFTRLQVAALGFNQLTHVPTGLFQHTNLRRLYLNNNCLSGLPPMLSQLQNLQHLNVAFNNIVSLPTTAMGNLTSLQSLSLQGNRLLTAVPQNIGHMRALKELHSGRCAIEELPITLREITTLEHLNLGYNNLKAVPTGLLGFLVNVVEMDLGDNQLTEIPEDLYCMSSLVVLRLKHNSLFSVPEGISNLKRLKVLHLQHNLLKRLPCDLSQLAQLQELYLSNNEIEFMPDGIDGCPALRVLNLEHNKLAELPQGISCLPAIEKLQFSKNSIEALPEDFGENFPNIKVLTFTYNLITRLPLAIGSLTKLQIMEWTGNPLIFPKRDVLRKGRTAVQSVLRSEAR